MIHAITSTKKRLFWTLQIAGWSGYAVLNYLFGVEVTDKPGNYFVPSLLYALGGIIITWGLRFLFRALSVMKPALLLMTGALGSIVASIAFTGFRSLVYVQYYPRYAWTDLALLDYFNLWDLYVSIYVIGTWSALYFGIRYYREVQLQNERLLKATSAAHEAQLKVLRYQLNPHFLFNTLNAISTLTLEGQKETANQLITELSAFLRHTLESKPMQKVPLRKEMDMLDLYLSIEQVRFEDLLVVKRNIDPAALGVMVPAMILQPLIENAIRRSIASTEEGGEISIAAFIEDGKLSLRVADSPGNAAGVGQSSSEDDSGLASTRERLNVLYSDEQELRLEPFEPGGLGITICIPVEHSKSENT
jgi:hypothetical protein